MLTSPVVLTAATVGTSSGQASAARQRKFLMLANPSATSTVWIGFGVTAVASGPGCIALPPGTNIKFDQTYVPSDQINAIASGASSPLTIIE